MTSNHHAPYDLGHTRATMDGTEGSEGASRSGPQKPVPSSDCSLQLDCTKPESLVIADQHAAVNTFSGLVHTARHTMRAGNTRSRWPNRKEGAVEGRAGDWGQVVTRYPYENVGMDHLLSKEPHWPAGALMLGVFVWWVCCGGFVLLVIGGRGGL